MTGPREPHPIELRSYEILRSLVDLSHLPPLARALTERVVHASADLGYADDLVLDERSLEAGLAALRAGAPIVVDSAMVASGITSRDALCLLGDPRTRALAERASITRSAAAIRLAAEQVGEGAVWVIGNAPTALFELLALAPAPALVVGLPVGFVGAAESKHALARSGLPCATNRSSKGGSAVAAAALNALLYFDGEVAGVAAGRAGTPAPESVRTP